jgi:hypothetical protein
MRVPLTLTAFAMFVVVLGCGPSQTENPQLRPCDVVIEEPAATATATGTTLKDAPIDPIYPRVEFSFDETADLRCPTGDACVRAEHCTLPFGPVAPGAIDVVTFALVNPTVIPSHLNEIALLDETGFFAVRALVDGVAHDLTTVSRDTPLIVPASRGDEPRITLELTYAPSVAGVHVASLVIEGDAANFEQIDATSEMGTATLLVEGRSE